MTSQIVAEQETPTRITLTIRDELRDGVAEIGREPARESRIVDCGLGLGGLEAGGGRLGSPSRSAATVRGCITCTIRRLLPGFRQGFPRLVMARSFVTMLRTSVHTSRSWKWLACRDVRGAPPISRVLARTSCSESAPQELGFSKRGLA